MTCVIPSQCHSFSLFLMPVVQCIVAQGRHISSESAVTIWQQNVQLLLVTLLLSVLQLYSHEPWIAWDILLVISSVAGNLCNKCPKQPVEQKSSSSDFNVSIEQQSPRRPCDSKRTCKLTDWYFWHCNQPQQSCDQGNIFTPVCHSVHRGVCLSACWDTTPPGAHPLEQTPHPPRPDPPGADPPGANPPGTRPPPTPGRLQHTVYERPVRILLECILVSELFFECLTKLILKILLLESLHGLEICNSCT